MERYAAEFKYGTPRLTRIQIEKETAKMIRIAGSEPLIRYMYFSSMARKDKLHLFESQLSALEWLKEQAEAHRDELRGEFQKALEEASSTIKELEIEVSTERKLVVLAEGKTT